MSGPTYQPAEGQQRPLTIGTLYFDTCRECGEDMYITLDDGISHHQAMNGDIDYDLDGDHVAVAKNEP